MNTRERVGNTYHRGNTYPREGEQISLLVHQGEHISPRAWLEISVRGNRKSGGTHISVTAVRNSRVGYAYILVGKLSVLPDFAETLHHEAHAELVADQSNSLLLK